MTDQPDHIDELLRRANPVDEARLPLPAEHDQAQLLYEKITGIPYAGRRPRRSRFGQALAVIAALAAVGGGVAYASLTSGRVTRHLNVACYVADRLDATVAIEAAGPNGPVAVCADAWRAGRLGPRSVPLLVACVGPSGVAAVFPSAPGADVCGQLGLSPLPAVTVPATRPPPTNGGPTTTDVLPQVRDAIVKTLQSACTDSQDAKATVEGILAKAGVAWTVTVPIPFPPGRPCASPGFDEAHNQVVLVGVPTTDIPGAATR